VLGALDDHFFRWVTDIGVTGPDEGQGGSYLILPPGYEGEIPDGYHIVRPRTYRTWWFGRGQLEDGEAAPAVERFRAHTRIYPLSQADNPPEMEFINASAVPSNTIHSNDFHLLEELGTVIQHEHPDALDPEERGLLASIGILSGQPFDPDDRMRAILERSADTAYGMVLAITYDTRDSRVWVYPDRRWKTGFIGGSHEFVRGDGSRDSDARSMFHYYATGITPAMSSRMVGRGSQYLWTNLDGDGEFLDGAKTYRLHLPPNIPAEAFWSVTVYDPYTRSMLPTDQHFPAISTYTDPVFNEDGSIDILFAPERPEDVPENNWIQTDPDTGWHTILRCYSPSQAFFDQTWRPDDIVEVP
jgi:hypothetical protein